jgi:hypothetical protein
VPHLHSAQADPQPNRDLGERSLFHISEFEELSVACLETLEGLADLLTFLVAD